MQSHLPEPVRPIALGIEGGGTQTRALLVDATDAILADHRLGPANIRLLDEPALAQLFRDIAAIAPRPDALGIGLAGARTEADRARIRAAAEHVWPGVPCHATNDLETAIMAAASARKEEAPRILVLSGTGSCCFGRARDGATVRVGGWGHILGDQGSGYDLGMRALRAVVRQLDRTGRWPALGARLLRALLLNEPEELLPWALRAGKSAIAALTVEVFAAAQQRDRLACRILAQAADELATDAVACATRLARPGWPAHFVLAGGVLLKQAVFARQVSAQIRKRWPKARVAPLPRESVWGAVELARRLDLTRRVTAKITPGKSPSPTAAASRVAGALAANPIRTKELSPTEQRNPSSLRLDKLSPSAAIDLMLSEDAKIPAAILAEKPAVERALRLIVKALRGGGRLFYVGAGTSGRLGVLDASECPPTFRTDPEMVQGIIAGGQSALWTSLEGAEDDADAGARALGFRGVTRRDVVVGIAASGRTPFVWGALREAKQRGAATVLICFNPHLVIPRADRPSVIIAPRIGPEVLTGSTRLKAGTATKIVLNIFTTLAMVRLGKVRSNLMVDVKASNVKLRDRAVRITGELTGAVYEAAQAALERVDWDIPRACRRLGRRTGVAARRQTAALSKVR